MVVASPPDEGSVSFESAMTRLKKHVYKNRVRLRDFISDFDKLRKGEVHPNNWLRAMHMAGVHKVLSPAELQAICDAYTVPKTASSQVMQYACFLDEVDAVFTKKGLERAPLEEVAPEPAELLDRDRFRRSMRDLGAEKEGALAAVMGRVADVCAKRGILLKPLFDDAANDSRSTATFGHVTTAQFKQCINVRVGMRISEAEAALLAEKFRHEDVAGLVNYIAFAATVDPEPVAA